MSVVIEQDETAAGQRFEKACQVIERHGRNPARLIPILQGLQDEYRYLPADVLTFVAGALDVPPARVFGVATFYTHFALEPKGEHVVRLCDGTACHVKGSIPILESIRRELKLKAGQKTTEDMKFTVETVACLGACGLAPVVVINEQVQGQMTAESGVALVREIEGESN